MVNHVDLIVREKKGFHSNAFRATYIAIFRLTYGSNYILEENGIALLFTIISLITSINVSEREFGYSINN